MTTYWKVDPSMDSTHPYLQEAGRLIRDGLLVAFPTETVYGLGADARNTAAVESIFVSKGRPSDNPLIVHIADRSQLDELVLPYDQIANRLMDKFWPGPLTIVLPVKPQAVSAKVTAGLSTVAVRMPDHPAALNLIKAAGCPIAAPSANLSGRPSPTRADHVKEDLDGKIAAILDAGPTGVGLESTVVELIGKQIHILRPGGVSKAQLKEVSFDVFSEASSYDAGAAKQEASSAPRSPGMKYTHYAPKGKLTLVKGGSLSDVVHWIESTLNEAKRQGEKTGVLTFTEHAYLFEADLVVACGNLQHPESIARELYAALRKFDEAGITSIFAEACDEEGIGAAIMNRLIKAAGQRIVQI